MMRSLYSGVAGLKTHQTRMDVIGNNIANVNTTAYKYQSMTFADLMYQTTQSASGANEYRGGINARQIGLGAKTSAIKTAITQQGSAQTTNDPFDIMISGEAFFVVSDGNQNLFTRDGSFYVDGVGNLCMTSTGYTVMGWQPDPENPALIRRETVSALRIMSAANMTYPPEATTQATISGIVDSFDHQVNSIDGRIMNLEFYDNRGYKYTAQFSLHAIGDDADKTGSFYIKLDKVLDSDGKNVMEGNEDAFQFGSGTAAIKDAEGNNITSPTGEPDANGQPQDEDVTNAIVIQFDPGTGKFQYVGNQAGLDNGTATSADLVLSDVNFSNITIDFSDTSNYNKNGTSTMGALAGNERQAGLGAGRKVGEMIGVSVDQSGMIYASYDNGQTKLLGQIAVATFANASGLEKHGDNLYSASMNSGSFDGIGVDISTTGGRMDSGVLEMSNVDLSSEFTEMITTQRGFQANSRIITVSDTLLEELTNLKR